MQIYSMQGNIRHELSQQTAGQLFFALMKAFAYNDLLLRRSLNKSIEEKMEFAARHTE